MFGQARSIIAVSRHMRDQLIDLGAPPEKIEFNPYGIDVDLFSKGEPATAPPVFLAVGRFVAKKAPDQTIEAFAKISAKYPDARLEMIGDGPLHKSCRDLARHLGVSERVKFWGAIPHLEAARIMARARCFVQHSITPDSGDMEGTPLAVLEAMATRLPVVATRHGGIVDVVSDGETGYLVDEFDVASMANAMARLIESPKTASRMGAAGRAFVLTNHSMDQQIGALASILQRAAAPESVS
jgi:glycosyltransferase involved in cell wall biosynthesis